ncbi:MAG: MFS transporter [Nitriliruptorales bacterium]|nr:MFS transporter [Nitriliruptorales bacterium]
MENPGASRPGARIARAPEFGPLPCRGVAWPFVSLSTPSGMPSVARVAGLLGTLIALAIIGSSAVAVALPAVGEELDLDLAGRAWILTVFSLTFSISTALFGRLADLLGLRLPLRIGLVLFSAGSALAALAPGFEVLIAGRMLQGVGAGAVPVLALGVVAARFGEDQRVRVLSGLTVIVALVSGSGPLIGGIIAQVVSWRAVLALPVITLLIMEPVARLAPATPAARGRIDVRGAAMVAALTLGVVLVLQSPATGTGAAVLAAASALAAGAGFLLARHVPRHPHGFLPLELAGNRVYGLTCMAGLTLLAAYLGLLLAIPQMLSASQGWPPLLIGLALLPAAMLGAFTSRIIGAHPPGENRYRLVALLAAGSTAGVLLVAAGQPNPVLLMLGMGLAAAGFAGGQVCLVDAVSTLVDPSVRGVALGVFNLVFFTGGAVGTAATGGLATMLGLPVALVAVAALPAAGMFAALTADRWHPRPAPSSPAARKP